MTPSKSIKEKKNTKKRRSRVDEKPKNIKKYEHKSTRPNNPHAGLAVENVDSAEHEKTTIDLDTMRPHDPEYNPNLESGYDPDNDKHIRPRLVWAGKYNKTSLEIDVLPMHVHERIDPHSIIEKIGKSEMQSQMDSFFDREENTLEISKELQFYQHKNNWSNRFIAGDSLLVMNSLIFKENMAGRIQMIYIDPPYGINYASNFQPNVCKYRVALTDEDEDLTEEVEMVRAFRDTWEYGIHSYLTSLRDRLVLAKKLLKNTGSCFVQISSENVHLVRTIMDEIFGENNFIRLISYRTKPPLNTKYMPGIVDYIIWYAKDIECVTFNRLFTKREIGKDTAYTLIEEQNGVRRSMTNFEKENTEKLSEKLKIFSTISLVSTGKTENCIYKFNIDGDVIKPPPSGKSWKTNKEGMMRLIEENRVKYKKGGTPRYIVYYNDYPVQELSNIWTDTQGASDKRYVVQTSEKVIQRCMLMATNPGDLVFDPTCGSGTTAYIAEKFGRRWITCDTSRISINIAKQRLITSIFNYYELINEKNGVSSGFKYETVPHVTLGQIAQRKKHGSEILVDQPKIQEKKCRISGPFTVEAIPPHIAKSIDEFYNSNGNIIKNNEQGFQSEWRNALLHDGIRGRKNQRIKIKTLNPDPTTKWIHGIGKTNDKNPKIVAISFGPEYGSLGAQHVANTIKEVISINPKPDIVIFIAMNFDPEAVNQIEKTNVKGIEFLKVIMNSDLLTEDLKKSDSKNESFWLLGQPDIHVTSGKKNVVVSINGYDYYDIKNDKIDSSGTSKIVMWMLDTNYDGKSLCPDQIFFPMKGGTGQKGWLKLAAALRSYIDVEKAAQFIATKSAKFDVQEERYAAVKIIDDRGIESMKRFRVGRDDK